MNATWSISCRLPCPQVGLGARPPSMTTGEPPKRALAIALTPLVTPGPGGQRGDLRPAGELRQPLGGEHRRLLVADVDQPHALVAAAVVEREDVPAGQGEQVVHAGLLQGAHRQVAARQVRHVVSSIGRPRGGGLAGTSAPTGGRA
jgi:hypothetical protein